MEKKIKEWPVKKKSTKIRVDLRFKKVIDEMYPNVSDPERTRRILDRILGDRK